MCVCGGSDGWGEHEDRYSKIIPITGDDLSEWTLNSQSFISMLTTIKMDDVEVDALPVLPW